MLHGPLLVLESTAILDKVSGGNLSLRCHHFLQRGGIGSQVDIADVDAHDQPSPAILTLDLTRAFLKLDQGHTLQRDGASPGQVYGHILYLVKLVADLFRIPHRDAKPALPLIEHTSLLSAYTGLNHVLHVIHVQSEGSHGRPVDLDGQVGLSHRLLHVEVGGSLETGQQLRDVLADLSQHIQVLAINLDGQVGFHAAGQLVDPHGNRLGEVVYQSGFRLQIRFNHLHNIALLQALAPLVHGFEHHPHIGLVNPHPVVGQVGAPGFRNHGFYLGNIFHQSGSQPVGILD